MAKHSFKALFSSPPSSFYLLSREPHFSWGLKTVLALCVCACAKNPFKIGYKAPFRCPMGNVVMYYAIRHQQD